MTDEHHIEEVRRRPNFIFTTGHKHAIPLTHADRRFSVVFKENDMNHPGPVVVYGYGKTRHGAALAKAFGKKHVVETDQTPRPPGIIYKRGKLSFDVKLRDDTLYLTNVAWSCIAEPAGMLLISYESAMSTVPK